MQTFQLKKEDTISQVIHYIEKHWTDTVRVHPQDEGTLIGLPYPYIVPCRKDAFQELFYWDTYFACLGLVQSGKMDLAVSNLRNFLYLVQRFGFIPNGSRTYFLNRSQPPYLAPLVQLLLDNGLSGAPVEEALAGVQAEYGFWDSKRNTASGLARYGGHATRAELMEFFQGTKERVKYTAQTEEEQLRQASHTLGEAESGWDFTPRFEHRCEDFCPVDLNSNLYVYEKLLAYHSCGKEKKQWKARADLRCERLFKHCWNEESGAFYDYDYKNCRQSHVLAASTFHPLWAGLATNEQASLIREKALPLLELDSAIVTCERNNGPKVCQWDYPNAWPCLQTIAYRGLARYGFVKDARRIAAKYVHIVCQGFEETGDLWEKYNAQDGSTNTKAEGGYVTPAMMGWTAGAFLDAVAFLNRTAKDA